MKSILDPSFRYVDSASTDVAKTFARIRKQHKAAQQVVKQQTNTDTKAVLNIFERRK